MSSKEVAAAVAAIAPTKPTALSSRGREKAELMGDHKDKELMALEKQRKRELRMAKRESEKQFIQGRWLSDAAAMQNPRVRKHEAFQRHAPKKLAQMSNWLKLEDSATGIETEEREVVDRVTQADLVQSVDIQTAAKKYSLTLDKLGPYKIDYTINGTHLLLAGLRGHLANIRWKDFVLNGEVQLKDKINDAIFLVDHTMTAVAQKKYVYMYTKDGAEMHILSKMINMDRLAYLSRHMLLAAASSKYSVMQYMDISTGQELGAKVPSVMRDPMACMAVNPSNGVVTTCDLRGVVKFWSPSVVDPLVQLKGHKGVIDCVRFHDEGRFFVTLSSSDHKMKIWDCRTLRALEEYAVTYTFNTVDISSSGLVALGGGTNIQIWKGMFTSSKPNAPYMKFGLGYGNIAESVRFCPFEDVLGVGTSRGFQSLIIPGSGEANPDFYYANPHETERHRKERVVKQLLDKLPVDLISMDIQVPGVNVDRLAEYNKNIAADRRSRAIREKKMRRADRSLGDQATIGVVSASIGDDDELEETVGVKEKGVTKDLRTRKERQQDKAREKKMKRWDQKDSADKVRSKQTMRHSKIVQKMRHKQQKEIHKKLSNGAAKESTGGTPRRLTDSGGVKRSRSGEGTSSQSREHGPIDASNGAAPVLSPTTPTPRKPRVEPLGLSRGMVSNAALKRLLL